MAINATQIKVTFNKAVDKASATTLANYTLTTGGTAVLTGGVATLQADGMTVILDLATAAANQEAAKLTIKNVKDADGKAVAETTKDVSFFDVTLPVAEKVEVTGTKTLKVTFSEPIDDTNIAKATFKIDGGKYSAPTAAVGTGANKNEVTLTLPVTLPVGAHTVTIAGVEDFAGFKNAETTLDFTYAADTTAPTVTLKEVKSDAKTVVLEFSKAIDSTKLATANVTFSHTYKGENSVAGNTAGVVTKVSDSVYEIKFANPLAPGTTSVFVDYIASVTDANKVTDLFGNKLVLPVTLSATVVADTVAPTVEMVEAKKANQIEVTFSEDVTAAAAQTVANYKLTNDKNEVVAINTVAYVAGDKKATITTTADLKAGNYKLEVKNITDKAVVPNKMTTVVKDFAVADKVAPKVASVVYDDTNKKIIVKFDKDMAQAGLTTLSNYALTIDSTNTAFPTGTVVAIKDAKTVEITLGKVVANLDGTTDSLQVSGALQDNLGNAIGGMSTSKAIQAAASVAPAVIANTAKFIDAKTITFEVDTELKGIDSSVTNYIQYDSADVASATYENQGNKALVTVEVAQAKVLTDTSATGISKSLVIAAEALESSFGGKNEEITIASTDIADKAAPIITEVETADESANGQIDKLTVTLSEAVLASSIQESDFSISDGYTVKSVVSVNGTSVVLKLNESGTPDTAATPTVTIAGEIEDLVGNKTTTTPAVVSTDVSKPVLLSVETDIADNATAGAATNKIRVTFSEPVKAVAASEFVLGDTTNKLTGNTATAVGGGTEATQWIITLGTSAGTPAAAADLVFTRTATTDNAATPNNAEDKTIASVNIVYGVTFN